MSYISEIFERLDIQHVREFLKNGVEAAEIDSRPYKERLESTQKTITKIIHDKIPNKDDREQVINCLFDYSTACENVYMEIGMQCGFKLAAQMMANTLPPEKERD